MQHALRHAASTELGPRSKTIHQLHHVLSPTLPNSKTVSNSRKMIRGKGDDVPEHIVVDVSFVLFVRRHGPSRTHPPTSFMPVEFVLAVSFQRATARACSTPVTIAATVRTTNTTATASTTTTTSAVSCQQVVTSVTVSSLAFAPPASPLNIVACVVVSAETSVLKGRW